MSTFGFCKLLKLPHEDELRVCCHFHREFFQTGARRMVCALLWRKRKRTERGEFSWVCKDSLRFCFVRTASPPRCFRTTHVCPERSVCRNRHTMMYECVVMSADRREKQISNGLPHTLIYWPPTMKFQFSLQVRTYKTVEWPLIQRLVVVLCMLCDVLAHPLDKDEHILCWQQKKCRSWLFHCVVYRCTQARRIPKEGTLWLNVYQPQ